MLGGDIHGICHRHVLSACGEKNQLRGEIVYILFSCKIYIDVNMRKTVRQILYSWSWFSRYFLLLFDPTQQTALKVDLVFILLIFGATTMGP